MSLAACAELEDASMFFDYQRSDQAAEVCYTCPVYEDCALYADSLLATDTPMHGVYAGSWYTNLPAEDLDA